MVRSYRPCLDKFASTPGSDKREKLVTYKPNNRDFSIVNFSIYVKLNILIIKPNIFFTNET